MISLNIFQILLLIGLGNSIILLISFTRIKSRYRKPALFLGLFIMSYLLYQVDMVVVPQVQSHLSFILPKIPVLFFLPPLFFYFAISTFDKNFKVLGKYLFLLIPGLIDVFYQLAVTLYVQNVNSGAIYEFITGRQGHLVYEGTAIFFSFVCLILLLPVLLNSKHRHKDTFHFFKYILGGIFVIMVHWISIFLLDLLMPGSYNFNLQYYLWIFDSAFFLFIGYKILTMPRILKTADTSGFITPAQAELKKDADRMNRLIIDEKLYINENLSRKDLADRLTLSEVHISSIIKNGMKTSFYELINFYRVKEAIRLIEEGGLETFTMQALAKQAGFKSKSTFNKAFKKHAGTTPSKYQK